MLTQIRNLTRGWVAGVIIGFLALALGIWGINDIFSGVGGDNVARVGSQAVSAQELSRDLDLALRQQQSQLQPGQAPISRNQAIEGGLHLQVLNAILNRRAMHAYAEKLGAIPAPAQIADAIREIPAAQNPITNTFDRETYNSFVRELGFTPAQYEAEIRGELAANMVLSALTAGARAPSSYGALALAFETERRVVALAEVPAARVQPIPDPTETQLDELYNRMSAQFAVPEYRALTLVAARADDFVDRVQVPEADIRAEFDAAAARLAQPEKRTFAQVTAPNEAAANDAARRLAAGETAEAAARAVGGQAVAFTSQARAEIPDPQIAEAVFTMQSGAAPRVVRGRLAPFAAVRLDAIIPAITPTLETERETIRARLAQDRAAELMNEAVRTYENARDEGRSVADAASAAGLAVTQIPAVDAQGLGPDGAAPEALIDQGEVVETAFQTPEGDASDFIAGADGADYIVEVTGVTPATTRPLEAVRDTVLQVWRGQETARRLRDLAQRIATAVDGGQSFETAARAQGARILETDREIDRRMASQIPAQNLGLELFGARVGEVVSGVRLDGNALILGQVQEVRRTDPAQEPQALAAAREAFQQQLGLSIAEAVQADALRAANARTNQAALDRLFPRTAAAPEDGE